MLFCALVLFVCGIGRAAGRVLPVGGALRAARGRRGCTMGYLAHSFYLRDRLKGDCWKLEG